MALTAGNAYPAATRRLRLGIVGGGRGALVGKWHEAGFRLSNRWELVAGALSSDPDVARASGRDWMLAEDRAYTDYAAMARAEAARPDGIEAVTIVTPNHTHRSIAEAFLEAGIDVICDKPITNSIEDANALVRAQQTTGLVFAVTYPYAFHAMVRQAREMVAGGVIGAIRQFQLEYAEDWAIVPDATDTKAMQWRRDPAKVGRASAAGDIGTHAFHLIEFVTGRRVERLRAELHVCGAPKAMDDTAFMNLALDNGAPGALWLTQAAPGQYCGLRFRVFGDGGGLEWDQEKPESLRYVPVNAPEQIIVRGHGGGVLPAAGRMVSMPRGHGETLTDAWANLYREIAVAVAARRSGEALPAGLLAYPTVEDGARGVRFTNRAVDSHEAGGSWVDFDG
jgi:predicted dehydrogenase